jgi:hypothetical protein
MNGLYALGAIAGWIAAALCIAAIIAMAMGRGL